MFWIGLALFVWIAFSLWRTWVRDDVDPACDFDLSMFDWFDPS